MYTPDLYIYLHGQKHLKYRTVLCKQYILSIGPFIFQPEPFFITLFLYDTREGKKISEDFHFDPNKERIRSLIPNELLNATDMLNSVNGATSGEPDLYRVDSKWLAYCDCVSYRSRDSNNVAVRSAVFFSLVQF